MFVQLKQRVSGTNIRGVWMDGRDEHEMRRDMDGVCELNITWVHNQGQPSPRENRTIQVGVFVDDNE